MQRQPRSSTLLFGTIAGGAGFVAIASLASAGGMVLSPAMFAALLAGLGVVALLVLALGRSSEDASARSGTSSGAQPARIETVETEPRLLVHDIEPSADTRDERPIDAGLSDEDTASRELVALEASPVGNDAPGTGTGTHDQPKWKPTQLPGTAELAGRKGSWRYEAQPSAANETATTGAAPLRLDAPREGGPDDLKRIKGIGPKIETQLHGLGIYHLDQIAAWTDEELAWVDEHLEGHRGRAGRDGWVAQARELSGTGQG